MDHDVFTKTDYDRPETKVPTLATYRTLLARSNATLQKRVPNKHQHPPHLSRRVLDCHRPQSHRQHGICNTIPIYRLHVGRLGPVAVNVVTCRVGPWRRKYREYRLVISRRSMEALKPGAGLLLRAVGPSSHHNTCLRTRS